MAAEVKMPPNNPDAEESVLGAVLMDGQALAKVSGFLFPQDFYLPAHDKIYRAMRKLQGRGETIDAVTLSEELHQRGDLEKIGGVTYLTSLSERLPSATQIASHGGIVKQYSQRRKVIAFARDLEEKSYNGGFEPGEIEHELLTLMRDSRLGKVETLEQIDSTVWGDIEDVAVHPGQIRGISTDFIDLDRLTGGMRDGEMIVLAARPSIGKTALALGIAANAAARGVRAGVISLEMSSEQLYQRLLFHAARVDLHRFNIGEISKEDKDRLDDVRESIRSLPLHIVDHVQRNIAAVTAAGRRLKITQKVDLLIVDYLQLIADPRKSLYEATTLNSGALKSLARDLNIPVLVAAQLNRRVEERRDKKPRLSDLRESGAIEQDADQVWLIHRPEQYGITVDKSGNDLRGKAQIIVAKNRNGRTGAIWLTFIAKYIGFESLALEIAQ